MNKTDEFTIIVAHVLLPFPFAISLSKTQHTKIELTALVHATDYLQLLSVFEVNICLPEADL